MSQARRHYRRITSRSYGRLFRRLVNDVPGIPQDGDSETAELAGHHGRPRPRDLGAQRYDRALSAVIVGRSDADAGARHRLAEADGRPDRDARTREPRERACGASPVSARWRVRPSSGRPHSVGVAPGPPVVQEPHEQRGAKHVTVVRAFGLTALAWASRLSGWCPPSGRPRPHHAIHRSVSRATR